MKFHITLFLVIMMFCCQAQQAVTSEFPNKECHGAFCNGKMINDRREGPWVFYKMGKIMRISYYNNDTLCGLTSIFSENGSLLRRLNFKNGEVSGNVMFYSSGGELIAIYEYEDGIYMKTVLLKDSPELPRQGHSFHPLTDDLW